MIDSSKISEILSDSPSVELLRLRNRDLIITFFIEIFYNQQGVISFENIHSKLADYLEFRQVGNDDENGIEDTDTYEVKAKKYIRKWVSSGFLTNYPDETGEVYYELSSHSSKTLDWLSSLKKQEYIGADSKFKNIFSQLKELVEYSNEDLEKRIQILEKDKLEIEQQIQRLKVGEDIKVFENFEIIPRFNQLTQSAKELFSDFKEVEDNFKEITKDIYQKHADESLSKSHILEYTFDALDELKESQQGKSFYAFWSFLLNPGLQEEWANLTNELYKTLENKEITTNDFFLKGMKKHLHTSGQKVYKANDKMAEKLSRIIRENENSKYEITKNVVQEIKTLLIDLSKKKQKPDISFELETTAGISIPFDRKFTFEPAEDFIYTDKPVLAEGDLTQSNHLDKLFKHSLIDKGVLRARIKNVLKSKEQTTLSEVIETTGGIQKGLPELFGYFSILTEFKYTIVGDKFQSIVFDPSNHKEIQVPEVILMK